ncbi:MAG: hypothetical protein HZB91_09605 [Elusimicrobia bacterium]|nr:hypothetical protein [Elusimicrobiota bacterium]
MRGIDEKASPESSAFLCGLGRFRKNPSPKEGFFFVKFPKMIPKRAAKSSRAVRAASVSKRLHVRLALSHERTSRHIREVRPYTGRKWARRWNSFLRGIIPQLASSDMRCRIAAWKVLRKRYRTDEFTPGIPYEDQCRSGITDPLWDFMCTVRFYIMKENGLSAAVRKAPPSKTPPLWRIFDIRVRKRS